MYEFRKRYPAESAGDIAIHECSPSSAQIGWMEKYPNYTYSYYYEGRPLGEPFNSTGCTNQDLCRMTFPDDSFDVFITQDVMEHIDRPEIAFREIERVLKPGGVHLFTTPIWIFQKTHPRIDFDSDGNRICLYTPVYHGDPINENGSLVTYDWGDDITDFIDRNTGFTSEVLYYMNTRTNYRMGLEGDYLYVVLSRKAL